MAEHDDKVKDVSQRLKKLETKPSDFDQIIMAERVELARTLCDDIVSDISN